MTLLEKINDSLRKDQLIEVGDKLLLAVSGGLDSVTLLHIFVQLKDTFKLELSVAHVHHGMRENEADQDLEFVKSIAKDHGLPFYSKQVDAKAFAKSQKLSLEESARILRYEALNEFMSSLKYTKLATAHTANDQAETVIDHFLRGSGSLGLRGMPGRRGNLIRPLLEITHEELESYAGDNNLDYRQDSSNKDLRFRRNRIRNELIPYLQAHFNPNLIETLNRTAIIFSENEALLQTFAEEAFRPLVSSRKKNEIILEIDGFLSYFDILQKYLLFCACQKLEIYRNDLNFETLERLLSLIAKKKIGKRVSINQDFELLLDHDGIVIKKKQITRPSKVNIDLLATQRLPFGDYEFKWTICEKEGSVDFNQNKRIEFLDFEQTGNHLWLRTYHPGDRFTPLNFEGQKKIADYFSDRKIPHHLRDITPVLESPAGIVWVCGHCIDDRFKIRKNTRRLLKVEMKESSNGV